MNNRLPPFDKLAVRKAVNYAIDRQRARRLYGGWRRRRRTSSADIPAVQEALALPAERREGEADDRAAGVKGTEVDVWGSNRETSKKPVEYLHGRLNKIGFKAKPKIIDAAVYWTTIGNQKTKAQIGFADWFQDYPHPLDWFDVLLNGTRITDTHNNNYSNFDSTAVNAKIAALKQKNEDRRRRQRRVGAARQAGHAEGRVGAVREQAVHGLLQHEHRHELATSTTCCTSSTSAGSA
jgi:peptide/nickel transport system substrate-binding protein